MPLVVRNTPRTDPEVVAGLATAGVAAVHEAQGRRGLFRADVRPVVSRAMSRGLLVGNPQRLYWEAP